jgi:type II secretory pathway component PulF
MLAAIKTIFWRGQFDSKARRVFYTALSLQLKSSVAIQPACDEIYDIYSDEGRFPNRIQAIVAQDCATGIAQGVAIFETLARWIPYDEQTSIEAGSVGASRDGSENRLALAFDRAVEIIDRKEEMRNALIAATAYPCFVLAAAFAVFYYMATHILPQLLKASHRPGHNSHQTLTEAFTTWFGNYGMYVGIATLVMVVLVFVSFPRLTGRLRVKLDNLQPWSTYRTVQGAIFIYNVGVILEGGGVNRVEMLERMMTHATPYMRERIDAVLNGVQGVEEHWHELPGSRRNRLYPRYRKPQR